MGRSKPKGMGGPCLHRLERRNREEPMQTTTPTLPRLLTAKEVAQQLHVSIWRIHEWTRSRGLPAVHVGRNYRYDPRAVDAWIRTAARPKRRDRWPPMHAAPAGAHHRGRKTTTHSPLNLTADPPVVYGKSFRPPAVRASA